MQHVTKRSVYFAVRPDVWLLIDKRNPWLNFRGAETCAANLSSITTFPTDSCRLRSVGVFKRITLFFNLKKEKKKKIEVREARAPKHIRHNKCELDYVSLATSVWLSWDLSPSHHHQWGPVTVSQIWSRDYCAPSWSWTSTALCHPEPHYRASAQPRGGIYSRS